MKKKNQPMTVEQANRTVNRVQSSDVTKFMDSAIRKLVWERLDAIEGRKKIAEEIERRIEVVVKKELEGRFDVDRFVQDHLKHFLAKRLHERVLAVLAGLDVGVEVEVTQKKKGDQPD